MWLSANFFFEDCRTVLCRVLPCRARCSSVPFRTVPCPAVPCYAMLCPALPCSVVPCSAVSCRALPYTALLCHVMPCHALLCSAVSCRSMSFRTMPCPMSVMPGTCWFDLCVINCVVASWWYFAAFLFVPGFARLSSWPGWPWMDFPPLTALCRYGGRKWCCRRTVAVWDEDACLWYAGEGGKRS